MDRRQLLLSLTAASTLGVSGAWAQASSLGPAQPVYDVTRFGAKGDGQALDSPAINAAIDACTRAGGGIVYLRPGTYRSGTVVIRSNVTLYLEAGSTLLGSLDLRDYTSMPGPPPKGDANDLHLVFARDAENIGIAGPGRIDGQGSHFWVPSGRPPLNEEDQWAEVAAHAWFKSPLGRPSPMLEFVGCRYLRIEDVRIENAAGWTMRPINCDNVFIRGISVRNQNIGPNTDGMDLTGSQNVFVSDCTIETGDDCICLKSENHYGSEPRLSRNIVITNCMMTTCCNGLKLGTATEGGFENITFSNSVIYNNPGMFKDRVISGIALEVVDGGWIDGVVISNIRMQRTRTPIFLRLGNRSRRHTYPQHGLRGVMIENIHASEALLASSITGLPDAFVEDITMSNVRVDNVLTRPLDWHMHTVPERANKYPEARMFGMLPASGLYVRHAQGLRLQDFSFRALRNDLRPTVVFEDVKDVRMRSIASTPASDAPLIGVHNSSDLWLSETAAPSGARALLELTGDKSQNILVSACDVRGTSRPVITAPEVPSAAVRLSGNIPADAG